MADQDLPTASPNGATHDGADAASAPQVMVNAQYIKDLSFESPRAPESFMQQPAVQPQVSLNVDVKARGLAQDLFESVLSIRAEARAQDDPIFVVELAYGAVVTVKNAPEEMVRALLLIEIPRLVFPFARGVIANTVRDGGYPPLLINPIDFAELARQGQANAQVSQQPLSA
jgi:preprotein translocase subunit SecB